VLFQQDGAHPHFHKEVTDFLNIKFPEKWIGRGGPITWLPRSPDLTPLDFSFGDTSRMLCTCHHWLPLCGNLLGGQAMQWLQLPLTYLTTCGLKLDTDMISAGPLMVPSLNICEM
jgi:hypothetical protein